MPGWSPPRRRLAILLAAAALPAAAAEPPAPQAAGPVKRAAALAEKADFEGLAALIDTAGRRLQGRALRLFYQGALIALENACSGKGDDPSAGEALRLAFLAGKYAGLSLRHLQLAEAMPLPPRGFGARLAAESVASYYYLGRLMAQEERLPPARRRTVMLVYLSAALRHWLALDARASAEVALGLSSWLARAEQAGLPVSFRYLADLATSPHLRDRSLPADAPLFYRTARPVEDRLLEILNATPPALLAYAAAETYAFPYRYRWLEPLGLALEKLHLASQGPAEQPRTLENIRRQLLDLRRAARHAPAPPETAPHPGGTQ